MAVDPLHALRTTVKKLRLTVPPAPVGGAGSSGSPSGPTIGFGPGSATAPSIAFSDDADTGLYNPAPNTIGLTLGGSLSWSFAAAAATGPGVLVGAGSASFPSLSFSTDPNSGFYSAGAGSIGLALSGVAGWVASASAITVSHVGGGMTFTVQAEGGALYIASRYSTNANGPQFSARKARGTIAAPAAVANGDFVFQQLGSGYGTTGFQLCTNVFGVVIEPTPSDTAMGGSYRIAVSPLGSITPSEVARFEPATGLSMFGANPVIDPNRTLIPGTSTVAGLPAVVTAGMRNVSDLEGGQGTVFGGASFWRNMANGQIAQNTISGAGVLSKMTGYFNFKQRTIVNTAMQMLSDYGLLAKLAAFGFTAVPTNSTDACLNWKTPGTNNLAITGSPTWTANQGFTGDGATALLSTVATLTALGATQNNISVGCFVLAAATGSAKAVIGSISGSARRLYLQSFTSGALAVRCNDQTAGDTFTPSQYTGLFVLSRNNSANFNASVSDAAATTVTRASVAQSGIATFLGTADATGSEFSNAQIAFWFVGNQALTATDIANLRWVVRDYYLVQMGAIAADYAVATLPLASTPPKGTRLNVTDGAAAPVFGAVPTGGGSLYLPVMTDTSAWHYG